MQAGFDMDLYLDWRRDGHPNGYNLLLRNTDTPMEHEGDSSYFNADSGASIASFLTEYLPESRLGIVNGPSRQTPTPLASSNSPNVLQSLSI